jgi:hypothetical protein
MALQAIPPYEPAAGTGMLVFEPGVPRHLAKWI